MTNPPNSTETLLVLNGDTMQGPNGLIPNGDTQARINRAYDVAREGRGVGTIAMIGGDAGIMRSWALHQENLADVEVSILSDDRSHDTIGNAHFSKGFLEERGLNPGTLEVVTADYHAPRTAWIFQRVFGREITVHEATSPYEGPELRRLERRERLFTVAAHVLLAGIGPEDDARREKRLLRWWPTYDESILRGAIVPLRRALSPRR